MPRNWSDFVDFLIELQADFPQDGSITLMGADVDEIDAREAMFFAIFDAYQRMVLDDPDSVDAQAMVDILTRLEQVDFTRFGQPAAERSEGDGTTAIAGATVAAWGPADYDPDSVLLTVNAGCTLASVEGAEGTLMVMSLKPDAPARLEMDCYVAFVNPYSENLDLALAFMETLAENLPDEVLYAICADLTEPVPDPNYESRLASAQAELERARQELAEADEIDRQALEDSVARIERYIADMEGERMLISEGEIGVAARECRRAGARRAELAIRRRIRRGLCARAPVLRRQDRRPAPDGRHRRQDPHDDSGTGLMEFMYAASPQAAGGANFRRPIPRRDGRR